MDRAVKEALRARAGELGFDDCRFTTADAPQSASHFEAWLAAGRHAEMTYLARNAGKRIDLQKILPGAKSIITLAAAYSGNNRQPTGQSPPPAHGVVARYTRFADYHDILGDKLKLLSQFVGELGGSGTRSLWYVDTGPILERDLAQRSGLGFVGKHTNLISRHLGNWILVAEILTTLEIQPDLPETNHCGKCAKCIAACPTGAIIAPFELDARLCISYLTIELKGPIPPHLRPAIGNRIFGCDDCLAACPWNRFAREGRLMSQHARKDLETPDLVELLSLDETGFRQRFAGTPIVRAKRRGFLRNVCVALGNLGDATALPTLTRAASDPEPLIAEHARWAIDQISQISNEQNRAQVQRGIEKS